MTGYLLPSLGGGNLINMYFMSGQAKVKSLSIFIVICILLCDIISVCSEELWWSVKRGRACLWAAAALLWWWEGLTVSFINFQADVSLFCFVVLLFVRVTVLLRPLHCAVCSVQRMIYTSPASCGLLTACSWQIWVRRSSCSSLTALVFSHCCISSSISTLTCST